MYSTSSNSASVLTGTCLGTRGSTHPRGSEPSTGSRRRGPGRIADGLFARLPMGEIARVDWGLAAL